MTESDSSPDESLPTDAKVAGLAAALSLKFPQLQSLLSANPGLTNDDLLPYFLLAELYHWLNGHAATAVADSDPETQTVIQLCGELFAMTREHDDLGVSLAGEITEAFLKPGPPLSGDSS